MTKDPKSYTHDEVVALLKRSIALGEAAKDRPYTTEDLVAAAKELDLDPELLRKAETELERRSATKGLAPRPFDTRVELQVSEDRFHLRVPPQKFRVGMLAAFMFSTFWFGFLSFWTWMAAKSSTLMAAFSLPFWAVGVAALRRMVLPLFQTTTLELGPEEGTLEIRPLGQRTRLRTRELRARLGKHNPMRQEGVGVAQVQEDAIFLEHGTTTYNVLSGFSEQERRWVLAELQAWLPAASEVTP